MEDFFRPAGKLRGSRVTSLPRWNKEPDLEYFRKKIMRASSSKCAAKYRRQLELLEDSIVIHQETRLPNFGIRARQIYKLPFFPFGQAKARNFLKKLLDR